MADSGDDRVVRDMLHDMDGFQFAVQGPVYIFDGFPEPDLTSEAGQRFDVLLYLLRSAIVPVGSFDELGEAGMRRYNGWLRQIGKPARFYAHTLSNPETKFPMPDWAIYLEKSVQSSLSEKYPSVNRISLSITVDPGLYARSFPRTNQIRVSATIRDVLRDLNLIVWNFVGRELFPFLPSTLRYERSMLRQILPLLFAQYRHASFSKIPPVCARDHMSFHFARIFTLFQLSFLLGHEYAHLILHAECSAGDHESEREADSFALQHVAIPFAAKIASGREWAETAMSDLLTSVQWLFSLLSLESAVGSLCNRAAVNWEVDPLRARAKEIVWSPPLGWPSESPEDVSGCKQVGDNYLSAARDELKSLPFVDFAQDLREFERQFGMESVTSRMRGDLRGTDPKEY